MSLHVVIDNKQLLTTAGLCEDSDSRACSNQVQSRRALQQNSLPTALHVSVLYPPLCSYAASGCLSAIQSAADEGACPGSSQTKLQVADQCRRSILVSQALDQLASRYQSSTRLASLLGVHQRGAERRERFRAADLVLESLMQPRRQHLLSCAPLACCYCHPASLLQHLICLSRGFQLRSKLVVLLFRAVSNFAAILWPSPLANLCMTTTFCTFMKEHANMKDLVSGPQWFCNLAAWVVTTAAAESSRGICFPSLPWRSTAPLSVRPGMDFATAGASAHSLRPAAGINA